VETLIPCLQKDDALLGDIRDADVSHGFAVWWLGQSGFLVKTRGGVILFDPYLSDSLTKKYAGTDKPHVRMTERAVDPSRLDMVDVVTSSHNHTDHLDAETLAALLKACQPTLVLPEANYEFAANRLGLNSDDAQCCLQEIRDAAEWEECFEYDHYQEGMMMTFRGVTAAHNEVERDEHGRARFMGFVAQFPGGCVYHSGDTLLHDGLVEQLKPFDIDVAFLPINGNRPERRVAGNLFGDEAAKLAKEIGAKLVVPCHYDMFTFNTESPELFVKTCEEIGQPCRVLRCGERLDIITDSPEKDHG
jgi:L-ascorbate metabolism protein UlaG (beta-lactamase superfamily)